MKSQTDVLTCPRDYPPAWLPLVTMARGLRILACGRAFQPFFVLLS